MQSAQAAPAWTPADVPDLFAWYHADDQQGSLLTPGAQAGYVPRTGDNAGGARTISASNNGIAPVYSSAAVDGKGGLVFTAAKQSMMAAAPATLADWYRFSDGRGGTILAFVEPAGTGTDHVIANTTGSTTGRGLSLVYDGVNDRFKMVVRGVAQAVILSLNQANGGAPPNQPYVVGYRYAEGLAPAEGSLFVDGSIVASGNTTGSPDTVSLSGMCIGRLAAAGLQFFDGAIRTVLFFSRALTDAEIADVSARMRALDSPRARRVIWPIGDSITGFDLYQQQIWLRSLSATSSRVNFVGQILAGEIALFTYRSHDGWVANTISGIQGHITGAVLSETPTDVCVMAGTNDITGGADVPAAFARFQTLIGVIRAQQPDAKIWICRPPRRIAPATGGAEMEAFAALLQAYAPTLPNAAYVNTDVQTDAMIGADGIHPTAAGSAWQGDRIADAMGF